jgi:hypothetical protein
MSDHSISIVPKKSVYHDRQNKATEILNWLVSRDIVKSVQSDCVLGSDKGYAISNGAKQVCADPNSLPFDLTTNGLELVINRQIFHTGENGIEKLICPSCNQDISNEDWEFFDDWSEEKNDDLTCPICNVSTNIHKYSFSPQWGFSNLAFTFWNWPPLADSFIAEFKDKLNCDVDIVWTRV